MNGKCPLPILAQSGGGGRTALAYARGSERRRERRMSEQRLLTRAARIGMAQQSAADGRTPLAYARGSDRNGAVRGWWTNTACLRARLGSEWRSLNVLE